MQRGQQLAGLAPGHRLVDLPQQGQFGLLVIVLADFAQRARRGEDHQILHFVAKYLLIEPFGRSDRIGIFISLVPAGIARNFCCS